MCLFFLSHQFRFKQRYAEYYYGVSGLIYSKWSLDAEFGKIAQNPSIAPSVKQFQPHDSQMHIDVHLNIFIFHVFH